MVTQINKQILFNADGNTGKALAEIYCLDADAKPTANIANGSMLLTVDTGKLYVFNETGGSWTLLKTIKE